jgi:hypothetical protein
MNDISYYCQIQAGIAQLVERNLAKVDVAGSSPVSRSVHNMATYPSGLRERSAKPRFIGSNPIVASFIVILFSLSILTLNSF